MLLVMSLTVGFQVFQPNLSVLYPECMGSYHSQEFRRKFGKAVDLKSSSNGRLRAVVLKRGLPAMLHCIRNTTTDPAFEGPFQRSRLVPCESGFRAREWSVEPNSWSS